MCENTLALAGSVHISRQFAKHHVEPLVLETRISFGFALNINANAEMTKKVTLGHHRYASAATVHKVPVGCISESLAVRST